MRHLQNETLLVVGLTGGMGSGKSTVGSMFSRAGIPVIDTDKVTHELLADRNSAVYGKVVEAFGEKILDADRVIDRRRLGQLVFSAPGSKKLKKLESILHPAIVLSVSNRLRSLALAGERIVVLEVPLLVEAGWHEQMDVVVVVDCDEDVQVGRYMERTGADAVQTRTRVAAQTSRKKRLKVADLVLDNSGSVSHLQGQVHLVVEQLGTRWMEKMEENRKP